MRLLDLEPKFIKHFRGNSYVRVSSLSSADGIRFRCPKCHQSVNDGAVHEVICWSPSVPPELRPGPGRWRMTGTNYHDLSLVGGSSSVSLTSGCRAHFFVENGNVRMA